MPSQSQPRNSPDAVDIASYLLDLEARGYRNVAVQLLGVETRGVGPALYVSVTQRPVTWLVRNVDSPIGWGTYPESRYVSLEAAIFRAIYLFDGLLARREAEAAKQTTF